MTTVYLHGFRGGRKGGARDAAGAALVGKRVRFKTPGPNGPMTVVGTVKEGVRPGEYEIKSQQGGYYKLNQVGAYEVLDGMQKHTSRSSWEAAIRAQYPKAYFDSGTGGATIAKVSTGSVGVWYSLKDEGWVYDRPM